MAVKIDAMPNKTFDGKVIEIGNTAILRSSGLAASQSTTSSQEAKDFKVVVALTDPPDEIRPGLSCNAKITTATRHNVLTIPIQALTVRTKGDLERSQRPVSQAAAIAPNDKSLKEEVQGVFVVNNGKAEFHKVETGITGATDIEVLSGLERRRPDHHRQLQGDPHHSQRGAGEGGQQNPGRRRQDLDGATRRLSINSSAASSSSATASSSAPGI